MSDGQGRERDTVLVTAGALITILLVMLALDRVSVMGMSEVKILPSGSPLPAETYVTPDGDTIIGNGTEMNKLRLGPGGVGVSVDPTGAPNVRLGEAVISLGTGSYDLADAGALSTRDQATALGLVSKLTPGVSFTHQATQVQDSGNLTLTTGQWDAITGGSGGLLPNAPYYIDAATPGHLTSIPPVGAGTYLVLVGIALSPTTMRLRLSVPIGPHA